MKTKDEETIAERTVDGKKCESEIVNNLEKILRVSRAFAMPQNLLKSEKVLRVTKMRIFNTVIRPTILYACKYWVLKKREAEKLERYLEGSWKELKWRRVYGEGERARSCNALVTLTSYK